MINVLTIIAVLLNYYTTDFNDAESKHKVIAIFGYSSHIDEDGNASRCDCDYLSYNIYLYNDKSFMYVCQRGRLSPKYESKAGTWEIVADELVLQVMQRTYTSYIIDIRGKNKDVTETYSEEIRFTKKQNFLFDPIEEKNWEHEQGLSIKELFEKYRN